MKGSRFEDCHYRNAITKTAAGHATIVSGVYADIHGIVANDWLERTTWRSIPATADDQVALVGAENPDGGQSPRWLMASTVGDQLKLRYGGHCKVLSVSNKDRAAVLMGGKFADAAYWMDQGKFVTSTYYRTDLPKWVRAFNARGEVERAFGRQWNHLLDREIYNKVQGPDDVPQEFSGYGLGRTLPKEITAVQHPSRMISTKLTTIPLSARNCWWLLQRKRL